MPSDELDVGTGCTVTVTGTGLSARQLEDFTTPAAVVDLLKNEPKRRHLIEGCQAAQQTYTIENMVHQFAEGIQRSLTQRV